MLCRIHKSSIMKLKTDPYKNARKPFLSLSYMKYMDAMSEMATWSVGPSSVGKRTVSTPRTMNAAAVFKMIFMDGASNLLVTALTTRDCVTSLTFFFKFIFGLLLSYKLCIIILSWADSIASTLGLCPAYFFTKKFLAAWISSSDASLLIPSRLYGSFTWILGKTAAERDN